MKSTKLSKKEFYSAILGMVLGDGYLRYNQTNYPAFSLCHSRKQKEYLLWKKQILEQLTATTYREDQCEYEYNGEKRFTERSMLDTRSHPYYERIYRLLYKNGKKIVTRKILNRLTPLGIAIWFMDDGTMSIKRENRFGRGLIAGRQMHLMTQSFTLREHKIIQKYFQEKHNIRMNILTFKNVKKYHRLYWGTKEGKKFVELVSPYIHPSMSYKIDFHYNDSYDISKRKRDWHGRLLNDEKVQRLKNSPSRINWMMR